MDFFESAFGENVAEAEERFQFFDAGFGEGGAFVFEVDVEVFVFFEFFDDL